jgi:hypothetical protein
MAKLGDIYKQAERTFAHGVAAPGPVYVVQDERGLALGDDKYDLEEARAYARKVRKLSGIRVFITSPDDSSINEEVM